MATLDSFFIKLAHSTKASVAVDHVDLGKVIESNAPTDSSLMCPTQISPEKQRHKRSLDGGNKSDRLKARKKQKVVVDLEVTTESKLLKSTENTKVELPDAVMENALDAAEVLEPQEISYEDFLAANRAACIRVDDKGINSSNCDVGLKISVPVVDKLSDSVLEKACDGNETVDTQKACKMEEPVEEPISTVLSKDIRSFFGKATVTSTLANDKKLCATLVKVKAQVHHHPNELISVSSAKHSTNNNRHVDLARWQKANIVITNADLDIEILSVCDAAIKDSSSDIKDASVAVLDKTQSLVSRQAHGCAIPITRNFFHEDVLVCADEKVLCNSDEQNKGTDTSVGKHLTNNNSKLHVRKKNESKTTSSLTVVANKKTCTGENDCFGDQHGAVDDDEKVQIVCDDCDSNSDATIVQVIEIDEVKYCEPSSVPQQSHQKLLNHQDSNSSPEAQSNEVDAVVKKADGAELINSRDKLADIFTPRSLRNVPAEKPSVVSNDSKSTEDDDTKSTRRHSSRLSAKAALDAISRSMEILQNTPKIQNKKSSFNDDDDGTDSDVEFADSDTLPKEAKSKHVDSKTVSGKGAKLAPIFEKQSTVKVKKSPVLSAAEIEARRIRREFLISGVPEELKRQQEASQALAFYPTSAAWPKYSHIQQRPSDRQQNVDPWNLDEVKLPLRPCRDLYETPQVRGHGILLPGVILAVDDKSPSRKLQMHEDLSKEIKSLLLNEVRTHNRQFPAGRFYSQLISKQNLVEPLIKNTIDDAHPSQKTHSSSAGVQQVDVRGEKDVDQEDFSDGENMMWTDKYAPRCATEIIGNWSASKKLREWLTLWNERITRVADKSTHKGSGGHQKVISVDNSINDDSEFDYSIESYDSDDLNSKDSDLCNAMVLYGPHGIGKTAMVYAMASELGFKIFEVNSSGKRDGRHVLAQLQEATQSHQVSRTQTISANLVDNERLLSSASSSISESGKVKHSNKIKKQTEEKSHASKTKANGEARPFASLFAKATLKSSDTKKQDQTKEESTKKDSKKVSSKIDLVSSSKKPAVAKKETTKKNVAKTEPEMHGAKLSNSDEKVVSTADSIQKSLILFEEVDVVLEEDRGFWNAIETFMHITKRPIVLTASDSQFISRFTGRVESIKLHTPQLINTASYLQMICIVENVRTSFADLLSLVSSTRGDIRQALLKLQCWVQTGASGSNGRSAPVYACIDLTEESKTADVSGPSVLQTVAPKVAPSSSKTRGMVKQITGDIDSDGDFSPIRMSGKRRRIQKFASSHDDSQSSKVIVDDSSELNVDDCSQESCRQAADVSGQSVHQTVAPKVAPSSSKTRGSVKQITGDIDSDGDFAPIRMSGKRRRFQRFASSEDDSQSSAVIVDDSSQLKDDFDIAVPFLRTIALDCERAPLVHQIDVNFIGGCNTQSSLLVEGEALRQPQWIGDCWWPTLPIFDSAIQDQSMFKLASSDCGQPSSRSMYALYDHYSFVDCCYSQRYCCESADSDYLLPGNSDTLPCNDFRNLSLKHRQECNEMRSVLNELVHKATDKWHLNKHTSNDGEQAHCLRQDVGKYEKLAIDVRLAGDYIMSHHLGLQRQALSMDYLPSLRAMAKSESIRQVTNSKRRFYHHLRTTFPDLKPYVINHLCTAFS